MTEKKREFTLFALEIIEDNGLYVYEEDIKELPFYEFWKESASGSNMRVGPNGGMVHLADWEAFALLLIKEGRHRYQPRKISKHRRKQSGIA